MWRRHIAFSRRRCSPTFFQRIRSRFSTHVAVRVKDLHQNRRRNTGSLPVPFFKTNQDGATPDYRFGSAETIARIRAWQAVCGIAEGILFRPTGGRPRADVRAKSPTGITNAVDTPWC